MLITLQIARDEEAGVFVATSRDLRGLVVEAASVEELHKEVQSCIDMLMVEELRQPPRTRPVTAWPGDFLPA